jgi:hypothetical protein
MSTERFKTALPVFVQTNSVRVLILTLAVPIVDAVVVVVVVVVRGMDRTGSGSCPVVGFFCPSEPSLSLTTTCLSYDIVKRENYLGNCFVILFCTEKASW